jgi:hypothetical protein
MSYRIGVKINKPGNGWVFNEVFLKTRTEAVEYAIDLFSRWTSLLNVDVIEAEDPVNARYENHRIIFLEHEDIQTEPEDEQ